jgi:hypothetical protein
MARPYEETLKANRERMRREYHSDPVKREKRLAASRRWHESHPELSKTKERNRRYQRKYGITTAKYDELAAKQNGVCALCKRPPTAKKRLVVDHNHSTGMIRGLLCDACNRALGLIEVRIGSMIPIYFYLGAETDPWTPPTRR